MDIQRTAFWVGAIIYVGLVMGTLIFDILAICGGAEARISTASTMVFIFIAAELAVLNVYIGSVARHLEKEKKNE